MMKPILFNTAMVRSLLAGRKSVTRRVVKPQPVFQEGETGTPVRCDDGSWCFKIDQYNEIYDSELRPPYQTGDILYVRETWYKDAGRYMYKANYSDNEKFYRDGEEVSIKWFPSIHMPKEAARLFLRVTDVRVERLRDISLYDVWDEGTPQMPGNTDSDGAVGHEDFAYLWDSTIKKADLSLYGWEANPWVWVISFERISKEEAIANA